MIALKRDVMWSGWDQVGLEHLQLVQGDQGILADGMILTAKDGHPFRVHYQIRCDLAWNVRQVEINLWDSTHADLKLLTDGQGHWTMDTASPIKLLDGCLDVDISITPFTNTLPIRRLGLKPGQGADILAAYIDIPQLDVKAARQRYTCLQVSPEGGVYRYKGLSTGFTADLPVDRDGLVVDYPELCRRV